MIRYVQAVLASRVPANWACRMIVGCFDCDLCGYRIEHYIRGEILSGMVMVMTHRHNSVRVEGGIWTMSPVVVVEGPVFVGVGLMLRTAHSPLPSLF